MTDTSPLSDGENGNDIVHRGEPVSEYETKNALLVADHEDVVRVEGYGEMTVAKRTDPYYGPNIRLWDGETNYRLVGAGFARDPELWIGIENDEGFIEGWRRVGHVGVELAEIAKPERCECGELLSSRREKRAVKLGGVCPHEAV